LPNQRTFITLVSPYALHNRSGFNCALHLLQTE
jgi:hypothetical protein